MFHTGDTVALATFDDWGNPIPARPGTITGIDRREGVIEVTLVDGDVIAVDEPDALTAR